jgi:phosphopantothenoylcysteine decarboxylase/phosphopantothenate--cysteine ligase
VLEHGRAKLARKGCDLLVVNAVGPGKAFGQSENAAVILSTAGTEVVEHVVPLGPKALLAAAVWDEVGRCLATR